MAEPEGPFAIDPGKPFAGGDGDPAPDDADADAGSAAAPVEATSDPQPVLEVAEGTVRALLTAQGSLVHGLIAVDKGDDEWEWLQSELDAIVPPLTRIVNRYEALQQLAELGDPLAVLLAMGGYGSRSIATRAASRARQLADLEQEETGQAPFRMPE